MPQTFPMLMNLLLYFTYSLLTSQLAYANEPAFEAYYKFILGGKHTGYVIQRLEIDDKKKQMTSIYYTYVKTPSGLTTESLVAKAELNFEPISYQYSAVVDGKAKAVDATFKNKKMTASLIDGAHKQTATLTVPQNGFLSTFLNYVILKNGLSVGKNYEFLALAEESPVCLKGEAACDPKNVGFIKGTAHIQSEQKTSEVPSYKIHIVYKGIAFDGFVGPKGETLGSVSPLQSASTEMVATRSEAVAALPFNEKHVKTLFGNIPAGTKNPLHEKLKDGTSAR